MKTIHIPLGTTTETRWVGILKFEPDTIEGKHPAIIFLHGRGEAGRDLNKLFNQPVPRFVKDGRLPDFVQKSFIYCPQAVDQNAWFNAVHIKNVLDLIKKNPNVDQNRIYMTGFSFGGYGSWIGGQDFSDVLAAIVPICGCGDASKASKMVNLPVWAFHNDEDPTVNVRCSRDMISAIKKAGGNPLYTEMKSRSHDAWNPTYLNKDMWNWMFAQSKASVPVEPEPEIPGPPTEPTLKEQIQTKYKELGALIEQM